MISIKTMQKTLKLDQILQIMNQIDHCLEEKKTGLTKDELGIKKIMTKFVGLKRKTYSYLIDDCSKDKKAKGIIKIKCVIKRKLKFKYYKIYLEANQLVNTVYYLAKMKLT